MSSSKKLFTKVKKLHTIYISILCVLACRLFWVAVFDHTYWQQKARIPKRKKRVVEAPRGNIEDRFGTTLATNTLEYHVGIQYSECKLIPRIKKNNGTTLYPRREYIHKLSHFLSEHIDMSAQQIRDLIYSKALFDPHGVCIIKKNIPEKLFYFLKMKEKNFPGLVVEKGFTRIYPKGHTASHVIGYLGKIDRKEHSKIREEVSFLKNFIDQTNLGLELQIPARYDSLSTMQKRLHLLEQKVYSPNDYVGKQGIEKQYQHPLRGFHGIEMFEVDPLGKVTCTFSSSTDPIVGQTVRLGIISSMQEFAEKMLASSLIQNTNYSYYIKNQQKKPLIEPWIKPGSIIVMNPKNGQILAMASYPFYEPQDFANAHSKNISKWLETPQHKQAIFMQSAPLERFLDINNKVVKEKRFLTLDTFLSLLLPKNHVVAQTIHQLKTIKNICNFLNRTYSLAHKHDLDLKELCNEHPLPSPAHNLSSYNRALLIDLLQLMIDPARCASITDTHLGNISLADYRDHGCDFINLKKQILEECRSLFTNTTFASWRQKHESSFLKTIPKKSKRPYTYYLNKKNKEMFAQFEKKFFHPLLDAFLFGKTPPADLKTYIDTLQKKIAIPSSFQELLNTQSPELLSAYFSSFRNFTELTSPVIGSYTLLRKKRASYQDLALSFYPRFGFGYMRNHALEAQTPGSIFKLVIAMSALNHKYTDFTLTDISTSSQIVQLPSGKILSRHYQGGRLPKSYQPYLGWMNLKKAIKTSSNPYFSLLAYELANQDIDLVEQAYNLGFGQATGIDLPAEQEGTIPWNVHASASSLYSFAIGQYGLKVTPIQLTNMLASIANFGSQFQPTIATTLLGHKKSGSLYPFFYSVSYPKGDLLELAGIYFPLFSKTQKESKNTIKYVESHLLRNEMTQSNPFLLHAMQDVINQPRGTAHITHPKRMAYGNAYELMKDRMIGKTATAQIVKTHSLDKEQVNKTYKTTWFGSIIYKDKSLKDPSLVILINTPYGPPAKQLAAMAAALAQHYEETYLQSP